MSSTASLWISGSFGICVLFFLLLGYLASRRAKKEESDYLIGNRSFGTWAVALSVGGANNSGFMMLGAVGAGYVYGVTALWWPIAAFFGEWTYWTFFPGRLNRLAHEKRTVTVPDFITSDLAPAERPSVRRLAGVIIFGLMMIYLVTQFYAAGKVFNGMFDISPGLGSFITAAIILTYTAKGGLRASIWTDVAQAVAMFLLAQGILFYAIALLGDPYSVWHMIEAKTPELLDFFSQYSLWALIPYVIGFFSEALGFSLGQPHGLTRILAGRSPRAVQRAKWIYLIYTYLLWGAMTVFGLIMTLHMPALNDPEQALPIFASTYLSPALTGMVLAGMFSAIASTASAQLLVCSGALSVDISARLHALAYRRFGLVYQYAVTILIGLSAATLATLNEQFSVYSLVLYVISALACAMAPPVLIAVMRWPTHSRALIAAMVTGLTVSVLWHLCGFNVWMNETAPGVVLALLAHYIVLKYHSVSQIAMER